ncbi:hypothetical protein HYPP_01490 [Hyphomicrobium sp. ghe19]|nr:hypothetical protein HYPP_01490 [Hyphomicrobium sp. ghe19]
MITFLLTIICVALVFGLARFVDGLMRSDDD